MQTGEMVMDEAGRQEAPGSALDPATRSILLGVSTATISTVLMKMGLRNVWIRSARPLGQRYPRLVGRAFTLRFIPAREDRATHESLSSPRSTRGAVEAMPEGCIAVVDAMGMNNVGIFGDILCERMKIRGVTALVTDGAMRDLQGLRATGLPIWCNGIAAPPSVADLTFVGWQEPIACGGVAVFPDDIIVADEDGAVVVPAALLDEVVRVGPETEMLDAWMLQQLATGRQLLGLYPPDPQARAEFEAWRANAGRAGRSPRPTRARRPSNDTTR